METVHKAQLDNQQTIVVRFEALDKELVLVPVKVKTGTPEGAHTVYILAIVLSSCATGLGKVWVSGACVPCHRSCYMACVRQYSHATGLGKVWGVGLVCLAPGYFVVCVYHVCGLKRGGVLLERRTLLCSTRGRPSAGSTMHQTCVRRTCGLPLRPRLRPACLLRTCGVESPTEFMQAHVLCWEVESGHVT
jgi:hypothetical protein